jgi:hypothetical protein
MRISWLTIWAILPLVLIALHFGPGKSWLRRDDAAQLQQAADRLAEQGQWDGAARQYIAALAALPENSAAARRGLEVDLGRALVMSGEILEGQERLAKTLEELEASDQDALALAAAARYELGVSSYYAAWIMRLEGGTAEEWLPEAERARQQFRLLAEQADAVDPEVSQRSLEATIRLEQMDLSDLLARPRPKNCPNCKGGLCQRKRKQAASRCNSGNKEGTPKPGQQDARKEIKQESGAGLYNGDRIGS